MSQCILPLEEVSLNDVKRAGGKATSLGEMIRTGIDVLPGFVISTEAGGTMTTELRTEILKAFKELDQQFVAVRSSAVSEDGSSASWAGQLESYLNVTEATLIESIEKCWSSISSDRAKAYAQQNDVEATEKDVAVVVQAMIQSDVAGVAFSANPVTGDKDEVVIEAVLGIGEALVSGQITPDNYTLSKSGEIKNKFVANQTKKLAQSADGVDWFELGTEGSEQKLTDSQLLRLLELVIAIDKHYGVPVDIEWALRGDELFITQSRPITTL